MRIALFLANAGRDSGGPDNYECELSRALAGISKDDEFHLFCVHPNAEQAVGVHQPNVFYHVLTPRARAISMISTLPLGLARVNPKVVHATFIPTPIKIRPYVFTLVCFSMFEHPEFYPLPIRLRLRALTTLGVKSANLLVCVSEMVRERFAERFRVRSDRLTVIPLGVGKSFHPQPETAVREYLHRYGISDPYFLFSGRWEPRKNLVGIIDAFAQFKHESRTSHKLVLTGKRTWTIKQAEAAIKRHGLEREIIDLGKTPYSELPLLYAGAQAVVYASFYESFGMPIIEAMACGTPVITSNVTAMPETAGGAAMLVDPYRPESIAAAMHAIGQDEKLRQQMRERGLIHASKFSWERTARATLNAYQSVA